MDMLEEMALLESLARKEKSQVNEVIVDDGFPAQAAFVRDPSRYVTAICTRRAGKSSGLAYKYFNVARKHRNAILPYIGLTRESSKNVMWSLLRDFSERYKIPCDFKESTLTVELTNGSVIRLVGADQENFINKLKGAKYPFVAIDEAQAFGGHLQTLVDEVLDPAVADYLDGQIALTGTPGPVPKGYFYDASEGEFGFRRHAWTVYENPYFPRPKQYADDLLTKKGWTKEHPTFRREWLGEWVADPEALVYDFNRDRNITKEVPIRSDWFYVLGVDLGYNPDPSAFVLCAYSHFEKALFVIETFKDFKMTVSDVADRIKYYLGRFPTAKVTIDAGAQGKMIAEEISQRHDIPLIAADKHGKAGFIEIMNSEMAKGLVKVYEPVSADLVDEWMNLIWDQSKDQKVEDGRYANHLSDACLYAWRYCYNYVQDKVFRKPDPRSEEAIDQWWEQEQHRIRSEKKDDEGLYGFE